MNKIFDNNGTLDIEDIIVNHPSFIKIMEDGVVSDAEISEQSQKVIGTLHSLEDICNNEQIELIRNLVAEISVLVTINDYFRTQQ